MKISINTLGLLYDCEDSYSSSVREAYRSIFIEDRTKTFLRGQEDYQRSEMEKRIKEKENKISRAHNIVIIEKYSDIKEITGFN